MSTRINLHFTKTLDLDLFEKGVKVWLMRIVGHVEFKTQEGWSRPYEAIFDTGAPVSLIPLSIWKQAQIELITDYKISGIVPYKECALAVKVGNIICRIIGKETVTRDLKIQAYFTLTDRVPLILGFSNILTEMQLVSNYPKQETYLLVD